MSPDQIFLTLLPLALTGVTVLAWKEPEAYLKISAALIFISGFVALSMNIFNMGVIHSFVSSCSSRSQCDGSYIPGIIFPVWQIALAIGVCAYLYFLRFLKVLMSKGQS